MAVEVDLCISRMLDEKRKWRKLTVIGKLMTMERLAVKGFAFKQHGLRNPKEEELPIKIVELDP